MADTTLSISLRPLRFSEVLGQESTCEELKNQFLSGRIPRAWMFVGDPGTGKTTLARILALSLQLDSSKFGNPSSQDWESFNNYDIIEINAADANGVDDVRKLIELCNYCPSTGKCRVIILDEAQRLTDPAQQVLLKYFEDAPSTARWVICTTDPQKIAKALRDRCLIYTMNPLGDENLSLLVSSAIDGAKEPGILSDALIESNVRSPRQILMAVEKYLAGADPKEAAYISVVGVDTLEICRALVQGGDWNKVRRLLAVPKFENGKELKRHVSNYLRKILLGETVNSKKAAWASDAIRLLGENATFDESLNFSHTVACLFRICQSYPR